MATVQCFLIAKEWAMLQDRMRQELNQTLQAQDALVQQLLTQTFPGAMEFELQGSPENSCALSTYETYETYETPQSVSSTLHTLQNSSQPSYQLPVSGGSQLQRHLEAGNSGESENDMPPEPPQPVLKRHTHNTFSDMKDEMICKGCGNICLEDSHFCRQCGKKRPAKHRKHESLTSEDNDASTGALAASVSGSGGVKELYLSMTAAATLGGGQAGKGGEDEPVGLRMLLKRRAIRFLDWWYQLEEPAWEGRLAELVGSTAFQTVTMLMVLSNCLVILVVKNYTMAHLGQEMPPEFFNLEMIYAVYFSVELSLRLALHGRWFFVVEDAGWNIMDLVIVVLSVWGVVATLLGQAVVQLTFLRSLRTLRIARILRLMNVIKVFNDLRVMVVALINSLLALFWCCVMLGFITMIFSLLFVQLVEDHMQEHLNEPCLGDPCLNDELLDAFGSVQRAMLSLYMATSGGNDWSMYYNMLAETGDVASMLFIFYTAFYFFGTLNILTGLFVDKAMQAAQPDAELAAVEQRFSEYTYIQAFNKILEEFDDDHDGMLDDMEYVRLVMSDKGRTYLHLLGLEPKHSEVLYRELKAINRDGKVAVEDFVKGCTRMRGVPCNLDLRTLQYEMSLLREDQRHILLGLRAAASARTRRAPRQRQSSSAKGNGPPGDRERAAMPTVPAPVLAGGPVESELLLRRMMPASQHSLGTESEAGASERSAQPGLPIESL